jgi:hypothetical protein
METEMKKFKVKMVVSESGNAVFEAFATAKEAKAFAAERLAAGVKDAIYLGNTTQKAKDALMRSMGLVKVRGAVSGSVYWE